MQRKSHHNFSIISVSQKKKKPNKQPSMSEPLSWLCRVQNQCNGIARGSWEIDCWWDFRAGSWVGPCPTVSLGWCKCPELLCQQRPERCNRAPVWNWDENWAGSTGFKPSQRLCSTSRCIISSQDCSALATTEGCDFFHAFLRNTIMQNLMGTTNPEFPDLAWWEWHVFLVNLGLALGLNPPLSAAVLLYVRHPWRWWWHSKVKNPP